MEADIRRINHRQNPYNECLLKVQHGKIRNDDKHQILDMKFEYKKKSLLLYTLRGPIEFTPKNQCKSLAIYFASVVPEAPPPPKYHFKNLIDELGFDPSSMFEDMRKPNKKLSQEKIDEILANLKYFDLFGDSLHHFGRYLFTVTLSPALLGNVELLKHVLQVTGPDNSKKKLDLFPNSSTHTPIFYAISQGRKEAVELLQERGCSLSEDEFYILHQCSFYYGVRSLAGNDIWYFRTGLCEENFTVGKEIAMGGFATVTTGTLFGREVVRYGILLTTKTAVKIQLPKKEISLEVELTRFMREVAGFITCTQNLLRGFYIGNDNKLLIFMVSALQNLKEYLTEKQIPIKTLYSLTIKIIHGLSVIHQRGVSHRDIKPDNILVFEDGEISITDFGIINSGENLNHW